MAYTEEQLLELARHEFAMNNAINYVSLPQTKQMIIESNPGIPVDVHGLRTYSKRYRKTSEYLIVKFYPNTWREVYNKIKLN